MNDFFIPYIVLGVYLAFAVLVVVIARLIWRADLHRRRAAARGKDYPRSRIIEDLRPVQQAVIEFIDASPPSHELLRRLAEADEPIRVSRLLASVAPIEKSWIALLLIAVAGLVSFGRNGVLSSDLGREILARMSGRAIELGHKTPNINSWETAAKPKNVLSAEKKDATDGISPLQLVSPGSNGSRAQFTALPASTLNSRDESPAILTASDHRELSAAIVAAKKLAVHAGETQVLQEKLSHALISPAGEVPPDVITMYSRAELFDPKTDERLNLMPVFPIDASLEQGRVSCFDPLGVAILGRRVGDRIDWTVPYGVRHLEIRTVDFQPEAGLAKAA